MKGYYPEDSSHVAILGIIPAGWRKLEKLRISKSGKPITEPSYRSL
jgi:hypothetical protein